MISKISGRGILREKALRKLLRDTPELDFALIDMYSSIQDPEARIKLSTILMINNSVQNPFLEPKLIDKIKLNEDRSAMLKLLGDWGLQSKSNLGYLAKELPYMDKPQDVGAAIRAITGSSWVGGSALSPGDMQHLSELMSNYRGSEHAEIRAASVAALRAFPTKNFGEAILNSFDDPSEIVRREAMQLYANNQINLPELQVKLINRAQDTSLGYMERANIVAHLEQMQISEQQMQVVKDTQQELNKYFESLSQEERRALFSRWSDYLSQ